MFRHWSGFFQSKLTVQQIMTYHSILVVFDKSYIIPVGYWLWYRSSYNLFLKWLGKNKLPELEKKKRNENMDVKQMYPEVPTNGLHSYFHMHLVRDKLRNIPSLYFNLKARVTCKNRMWFCFKLRTYMLWSLEKKNSK